MVELGHSVAAPSAGQILGDLGAEVVKVEKAGGDDARKWGPPFVDGASATFQSLNRNKRSVVCDLRDAEQLRTVHGFIENERTWCCRTCGPAKSRRSASALPAMRERKPSPGLLQHRRVRVASVRCRERPGYDPLMQAFGGIMSVVGEPGRPPVRVGPSIIDMGAGDVGGDGHPVFAAAPSRNRRRCGRGRLAVRDRRQPG